jgi:hypothetical protein
MNKSTGPTGARSVVNNSSVTAFLKKQQQKKEKEAAAAAAAEQVYYAELRKKVINFKGGRRTRRHCRRCRLTKRKHPRSQ